MKLFKQNKITSIYDPDKNLSELANYFETDKGNIDRMKLSWGQRFASLDNYFNLLDTWEYTNVYEKYMQEYRNKKVSLLEIGICDDRFPFASPKMWASYFNQADLYAIDNFWGKDTKSIKHQNNIKYINEIGVNFIYADQYSNEDWNEIDFCIEKNSLDFIVEDGSHYPHHMMYTLFRSINLLKSGGYYFMEDVQNPSKSRGLWGYDNANVFLSMVEFYKSRKLYSEYIKEEEYKDIESNFTVVEFHQDKNELNYLIVLQKK